MKLHLNWTFLSSLSERKIKIPNDARRDRSKCYALEYIDYKQIYSLPIKLLDFEDVFEDYEWIVFTYDEAKKYLKVKDPLNIKKQQALARTFYPRGSKTFITVYVENKIYPRQDYYTLAHELGHIVLGHFFDFENTSLCRGGLTQAEYKVLEREAEIFAAEFIMPMPVLKEFKIKSYKDIISICDVTKSSAQIRMTEMPTYKISGRNFAPYHKVKENFYNFINKKSCLKCGHGFISEDAKHCPICGHKRLIWGDGKMIYDDGYALDEYGRAIECPICGNEEMDPGTGYCRICGFYLINKCTFTESYQNSYGYWVEPCGKIADGNSRYCEHCGSKTTFFENEVLSDWKTTKEKIEMRDTIDEFEAVFKEAAVSVEDDECPF